MNALKASVVACVVLVSGSALAAGYAVETQSAKATGMGLAMVASVNDSSGIYYNPAGLAQGPGIDLYLGDSLIIPSVHFTDPSGMRSNNIPQVVAPPNAYLAFGLDDMWSFGLGVFSPYGSVIKWHSDWEGAGVSVLSRLVTYDINPTVAWRYGPVRLGAGLQIVRSTLQATQALQVPDQNGFLNLGLGAWGVGGNGGIQVDAVPDVLTFGLSYRSGVRLNYSGSVSATGLPAEFAGSFPDQSVKTRLTLPNTAELGVSVKPLKELRLNADVTYTSWQQFQSLDLQFADPKLDQSVPKHWAHTFSLKVGGEYQVSEAIALRLGVVYDPTPSPDSTLGPDIPDATRINLCAGLGYAWGPIRADVGYELILLSDHTSTNPALPGKYSGVANVIGLNVGFHI